MLRGEVPWKRKRQGGASRSGLWTGSGSSPTRRPRRATGWGGSAWMRRAAAGRAGSGRGVRPRPSAADAATARRPAPPTAPRRDAGRERPAYGRRRRGSARRRVAGQRLAVHLIRNASGPRPPAVRSDGVLPPRKLRAVVEYIEEHLDGSPTLEQMAATAHLSVY